MKMGLLLHGLIALIGLALIVLGIQLFFSARKFRATGVKTYATVTDNILTASSSHKNTAMMYTPLLEYKVNGQKRTYSPNASANPPTYHIGEKVTIVYHPQNAYDVRIVSYWGIYLGSNILLAFGVSMLLIGGGYFLFKWGII